MRQQLWQTTWIFPFVLMGFEHVTDEPPAHAVDELWRPVFPVPGLMVGRLLAAVRALRDSRVVTLPSLGVTYRALVKAIDRFTPIGFETSLLSQSRGFPPSRQGCFEGHRRSATYPAGT